MTLVMTTDWVWETVLPHLQEISDELGFGDEWLSMCTERTAAAATSAWDAVFVAHRRKPPARGNGMANRTTFYAFRAVENAKALSKADASGDGNRHIEYIVGAVAMSSAQYVADIQNGDVHVLGEGYKAALRAFGLYAPSADE